MNRMKSDFGDEKGSGEKGDESLFGGASAFDDVPMEESWERESLRKQVKNLKALLVLVAGLFAGSLYVDAAQLFREVGFSSRTLSTTDIVSAAGKTWVAYDQPIVRVSALTDSACASCQTDEAISWLRRIAPTVSVEKLDVGKDDRAKDIAKERNILSIPAFVFSKEIEKLPIYAQAAQLFKKAEKGDGFVLDTAQVGIPVGKYLELPTVGDGDVKSGPDDAPVRVVEFTDFQCPFCKAFHATLKETLQGYGDRVQYVFKQYPIPAIHPNAERAALAGLCANDQGKFAEYADTLFAKQDEWGKLPDPAAIFKGYARTGKLDTKSFNECFDNKKYADKVKADMEEGKKFGMSGTPGTFVNGTFLNGAVPKEELTKTIDAELGGAPKDEENKDKEKK